VPAPRHTGQAPPCPGGSKRSTDDFQEANGCRVAAGKKPFVNPRNAVAVSPPRLEVSYVTPMSFAAYDLTGEHITDKDSHAARMAYASADLGFATALHLGRRGLAPNVPPVRHTNSADVLAVIATIGQRRPALGYPHDRPADGPSVGHPLPVSGCPAGGRRGRTRRCRRHRPGKGWLDPRRPA
jgi:DNA ligase (NAD+)